MCAPLNRCPFRLESGGKTAPGDVRAINNLKLPSKSAALIALKKQLKVLVRVEIAIKVCRFTPMMGFPGNNASSFNYFAFINHGREARRNLCQTPNVHS
jgi:hypothetical protein